MPLDLTEIFAKYEALTAEVDALFAKVKSLHPDLVSCGAGCSDCCHALFDVSLIEALYLNRHFKSSAISAEDKKRISDLAVEADRAHYKLKRKAFKATEKGVSTAQILSDLAKERIRCPLLNGENRCDLYDRRPITCRLYGLPLDIGGQAHTCGKTGFKQGGSYPTVKIEILQDRLMLLAQEFVQSYESKLPGMADMLVPVSMALLTEYDDEYLGVPADEDDDFPPVPEPKAALAPKAPKSDDACASCGEDPFSSACKSCKSSGGGHSWVIPGPDPDKKPDGEAS